MLIVEYSTTNKTNAYGGILFFEDDFENKTETEVKEMVNSLQNISEIPFLTVVDEEGKSGSKGVVRVSSNKILTRNNEYLQGSSFQNAQTLYKKGGLELVKMDTIQKSKFLYQLGLNVNLGPVADICKEEDYMYDRSVGLDAAGTSEYVKGTGMPGPVRGGGLLFACAKKKEKSTRRRGKSIILLKTFSGLW